MISPHETTPEALLPLIGTPRCPQMIDVRTDEDFAADSRLVPGARRIPYEVADRAARGPVVVICHRGLKLSHGVAALIRSRGGAARVLRGGWLGWIATSGAPTRATAGSETALWVTGPLGDAPERLAALWLIRRFVNRDARVLSVPETEVAAVADRFAATAVAARPGSGAFRDAVRMLGLLTPALETMSASLARPDGTGTLLAALATLHGHENALIEAALPVCDAIHARAAAT